MTKRTDRGEEHRVDTRDSRELDKRERDAFYTLPVDLDMETVSTRTGRVIHLAAPPPRIDAHFGKMVQRWVNVKMQNGARAYDLMQDHWRPRDPATVPRNYKSRTCKWDSHDVIMVANEMLLMELPEKIYLKRKSVRHRDNTRLLDDIKQTHNQVRRDSEIVGHDQRMGGGRFMHTTGGDQQSALGDREVKFAE